MLSVTDRLSRSFDGRVAAISKCHIQRDSWCTVALGKVLDYSGHLSALTAAVSGQDSSTGLLFSSIAHSEERDASWSALPRLMVPGLMRACVCKRLDRIWDARVTVHSAMKRMPLARAGGLFGEIIKPMQFSGQHK